MIDNLLENALQSVLTDPAGERKIELNGRSEDGKVLIEVIDNGAGLESEAQARALEPFFTTKETGTGLGLSISYEIVQAHGGSLSLRNAPFRGAIATVSLPEVTAGHGEAEKS